VKLPEIQFGEEKLTDNPEKRPFQRRTEILTLRLPKELMDTIRDFCADNEITVEEFAAEALSEKLSRWKE
jgi:hypothetical protein